MFELSKISKVGKGDTVKVMWSSAPCEVSVSTPGALKVYPGNDVRPQRDCCTWYFSTATIETIPQGSAKRFLGHVKLLRKLKREITFRAVRSAYKAERENFGVFRAA